MFIPACILLIGILATLVLEYYFHNRYLNRIPLRITVTGTRGKSSLVRMIAAVLREDGWRVTSKVTGSHARLIRPDGSESTLRRRGIPSIFEQKRVVRLAAGAGAECLVCEIMSIHPENHFTESRRLLKPHIVIITNLRPDHTDAMGGSPGEIARVFALDIPTGALVYLPEKEIHYLIAETVEKKGGMLRPLRPMSLKLGSGYGFFAEQAALEHVTRLPYRRLHRLDL